MQKLRCLPLLILIFLLAHVVGEETGIANTFNSKFNTIAAVAKEERTTIVTETVYDVSLLNDPKRKTLRIMRPPIKKSYLDSLEYIGQSTLVFEGNMTDEILESVLKELAREFKSNIMIIDNQTSTNKVITEGSGIGIGGKE